MAVVVVVAVNLSLSFLSLISLSLSLSLLVSLSLISLSLFFSLSNPTKHASDKCHRPRDVVVVVAVVVGEIRPHAPAAR